jgi:hypothetical protein
MAEEYFYDFLSRIPEYEKSIIFNSINYYLALEKVIKNQQNPEKVIKFYESLLINQISRIQMRKANFNRNRDEEVKKFEKALDQKLGSWELKNNS